MLYLLPFKKKSGMHEQIKNIWENKKSVWCNKED